eukprot:3807634-Rhodomonas_salina.1
MANSTLRNSLLSAILGTSVNKSTMLSDRLHPVARYDRFARWVKDPKVRRCLDKLADGRHKVVVQNSKANSTSEAYSLIFKQLADLKDDLDELLPMDERGSVLDLVCDTEHGIIHAEVQVQPQNSWDLRIMHYACGLFHRQFKRGMRWDSMHKDPNLETKIKRVVAISIFDRPPQNSSLQELLPWCAFEPWGSEELERRFRMRTDDGKHRGGIEFVDINLEA